MLHSFVTNWPYIKTRFNCVLWRMRYCAVLLLVNHFISLHHTTATDYRYPEVGRMWRCTLLLSSQNTFNSQALNLCGNRGMITKLTFSHANITACFDSKIQHIADYTPVRHSYFIVLHHSVDSEIYTVVHGNFGAVFCFHTAFLK